MICKKYFNIYFFIEEMDSIIINILNLFNRYLDNNQLNGTIPTQLGHLTLLQYL